MAEWEAYDKVQPIGAKRNDFYFAYAMMSLYNLMISAHGKKGSKQTKFEDFYPNWTGEKEEPQPMSTEQMKELLTAFATQHNKNVRRENKRNSKKPKT